jgi:hypothetical protein
LVDVRRADREQHKVTGEEVRLALRNRGMPLEARRRPITPIGMYDLLVHLLVHFELTKRVHAPA